MLTLLLISSKDSSRVKSSLKFNDAIGVVLKHEGGYVNDKSDPGGETRYGISKRAYPDLDIKNLTISQATEIYKKDYWLRGKCDKVPPKLRLIYFDMVVNMGKKRAVKILQTAINNKGVATTIDGGIGPQTLNNLRKAKLEPERLRAYRVKYYGDLVNRKPSLERYYYGWYRRAIAT